MHDYDYSSMGGAGNPSAYSGFGDVSRPPHRSPFALACTIAFVAVAAVVGLGVLFWALGFVFAMLGWILRIAILAAVGAFVWHRLSRRWSNTSS